MASLLVVIFLIQLAVFLINSVGAHVVNELAWKVYNSLPTTSASSDRTRLAELRREVVRLKRELGATSAQDQFAKWARLQRQHDKAAAEYDKKAQVFDSRRTNFDRAVTIGRWTATTGLGLALQAWYIREPVFWLPRGLVPAWVEWLLACPRAPQGSVSVQVWQFACASFLGANERAARAVWTLATTTRTGTTKGTGTRTGTEKEGGIGSGNGSTGLDGKGENVRKRTNVSAEDDTGASTRTAS